MVNEYCNGCKHLTLYLWGGSGESMATYSCKEHHPKIHNSGECKYYEEAEADEV